jgi:hypothetical protein
VKAQLSRAIDYSSGTGSIMLRNGHPRLGAQWAPYVVWLCHAVPSTAVDPVIPGRQPCGLAMQGHYVSLTGLTSGQSHINVSQYQS